VQQRQAAEKCWLRGGGARVGEGDLADTALRRDVHGNEKGQQTEG